MTLNNLKSNLKTKSKAAYRQLNRLSGGTLGIVIRSVQSFGEADASEAAASIAYYALFSIFPLLLFLVVVASSILQSEQVVDQILDLAGQVLPTSQELVRQNIQQVLALRGAVGLVATIGFLWGATSVFAVLARNINEAWHSATPQNFLESRLVGLIVVALLAVLTILSILTTTIFELLPRFDINAPLWDGVAIYDTFIWNLLANFVPWFFIFIMFLALYRWVPNTRVRWTEAAWGALVAAFAWELTKSGFTWFLSSGLFRYQLVYGSLGTVIALILWIYLSSLIILFGAHLSANIAHHYRTKEKIQSAPKDTKQLAGSES